MSDKKELTIYVYRSRADFIGSQLLGWGLLFVFTFLDVWLLDRFIPGWVVIILWLMSAYAAASQRRWFFNDAAAAQEAVRKFFAQPW